MTERRLERTLKTARALLDEATRIYRNESGGAFDPDKIRVFVQEQLEPYGLTPCFDASTFEFDIVQIQKERA